MRAVGGILSVEATVLRDAIAAHRLRGQLQQRRIAVALSIRLPQKPHPPRRAHGCRRQYHRPFGVVSKCALRDKRNGTLGCPNAPRRQFIVLVRIESPPLRQGSWKQRLERPFPVSLPPGSAVVSSLFAPYYGHASLLLPICAWLAVISSLLWS